MCSEIRAATLIPTVFILLPLFHTSRCIFNGVDKQWTACRPKTASLVFHKSPPWFEVYWSHGPVQLLESSSRWYVTPDDTAQDTGCVASRRVLQEASHGRTPGRRQRPDPYPLVRTLMLLPVWLVPIRTAAVSSALCTVHASERPALPRPLLLSAGLCTSSSGKKHAL